MSERLVKCMRCGEVLKLTSEQVKEIGEQANKHNWNSNKWLHYSSLMLNSKCITPKGTEFQMHDIGIFNSEDTKIISEITSNYKKVIDKENQLISREENLSKEIINLEEKLKETHQKMEQCKIEKEETEKEMSDIKEKFKEEVGTENIELWK